MDRSSLLNIARLRRIRGGHVSSLAEFLLVNGADIGDALELSPVECNSHLDFGSLTKNSTELSGISDSDAVCNFSWGSKPKMDDEDGAILQLNIPKDLKAALVMSSVSSCLPLPMLRIKNSLINLHRHFKEVDSNNNELCALALISSAKLEHQSSSRLTDHFDSLCDGFSSFETKFHFDSHSLNSKNIESALISPLFTLLVQASSSLNDNDSQFSDYLEHSVWRLNSSPGFFTGSNDVEAGKKIVDSLAILSDVSSTVARRALASKNDQLAGLALATLSSISVHHGSLEQFLKLMETVYSLNATREVKELNDGSSSSTCRVPGRVFATLRNLNLAATHLPINFSPIQNSKEDFSSMKFDDYEQRCSVSGCLEDGRRLSGENSTGISQLIPGISTAICNIKMFVPPPNIAAKVGAAAIAAVAALSPDSVVALVDGSQGLMNVSASSNVQVESPIDLLRAKLPKRGRVSSISVMRCSGSSISNYTLIQEQKSKIDLAAEFSGNSEISDICSSLAGAKFSPYTPRELCDGILMSDEEIRLELSSCAKGSVTLSLFVRNGLNNVHSAESSYLSFAQTSSNNSELIEKTTFDVSSCSAVNVEVIFRSLKNEVTDKEERYAVVICQGNVISEVLLRDSAIGHFISSCTRSLAADICIPFDPKWSLTLSSYLEKIECIPKMSNIMSKSSENSLTNVEFVHEISKQLSLLSMRRSQPLPSSFNYGSRSTIGTLNKFIKKNSCASADDSLGQCYLLPDDDIQMPKVLSQFTSLLSTLVDNSKLLVMKLSNEENKSSPNVEANIQTSDDAPTNGFSPSVSSFLNDRTSSYNTETEAAWRFSVGTLTNVLTILKFALSGPYPDMEMTRQDASSLTDSSKQILDDLLSTILSVLQIRSAPELTIANKDEKFGLSSPLGTYENGFEEAETAFFARRAALMVLSSAQPDKLKFIVSGAKLTTLVDLILALGSLEGSESRLGFEVIKNLESSQLLPLLLKKLFQENGSLPNCLSKFNFVNSSSPSTPIGSGIPSLPLLELDEAVTVEHRSSLQPPPISLSSGNSETGSWFWSLLRTLLHSVEIHIQKGFNINASNNNNNQLCGASEVAAALVRTMCKAVLSDLVTVIDELKVNSSALSPESMSTSLRRAKDAHGTLEKLTFITVNAGLQHLKFVTNKCREGSDETISKVQSCSVLHVVVTPCLVAITAAATAISQAESATYLSSVDRKTKVITTEMSIQFSRIRSLTMIVNAFIWKVWPLILRLNLRSLLLSRLLQAYFADHHSSAYTPSSKGVALNTSSSNFSQMSSSSPSDNDLCPASESCVVITSLCADIIIWLAKDPLRPLHHVPFSSSLALQPVPSLLLPKVVTCALAEGTVSRSLHQIGSTDIYELKTNIHSIYSSNSSIAPPLAAALDAAAHGLPEIESSLYSALVNGIASPSKLPSQILASGAKSPLLTAVNYTQGFGLNDLDPSADLDGLLVDDSLPRGVKCFLSNPSGGVSSGATHLASSRFQSPLSSPVQNPFDHPASSASPSRVLSKASLGRSMCYGEIESWESFKTASKWREWHPTSASVERCILSLLLHLRGVSKHSLSVMANWLLSEPSSSSSSAETPSEVRCIQDCISFARQASSRLLVQLQKESAAAEASAEDVKAKRQKKIDSVEKRCRWLASVCPLGALIQADQFRDAVVDESESDNSDTAGTCHKRRSSKLDDEFNGSAEQATSFKILKKLKQYNCGGDLVHSTSTLDLQENSKGECHSDCRVEEEDDSASPLESLQHLPLSAVTEEVFSFLLGEHTVDEAETVLRCIQLRSLSRFVLSRSVRALLTAVLFAQGEGNCNLSVSPLLTTSLNKKSEWSVLRCTGWLVLNAAHGVAAAHAAVTPGLTVVKTDDKKKNSVGASHSMTSVRHALYAVTQSFASQELNLVIQCISKWHSLASKSAVIHFAHGKQRSQLSLEDAHWVEALLRLQTLQECIAPSSFSTTAGGNSPRSIIASSPISTSASTHILDDADKGTRALVAQLMVTSSPALLSMFQMLKRCDKLSPTVIHPSLLALINNEPTSTSASFTTPVPVSSVSPSGFGSHQNVEHCWSDPKSDGSSNNVLSMGFLAMPRTSDDTAKKQIALRLRGRAWMLFEALLHRVLSTVKDQDFNIHSFAGDHCTTSSSSSLSNFKFSGGSSARCPALPSDAAIECAEVVLSAIISVAYALSIDPHDRFAHKNFRSKLNTSTAQPCASSEIASASCPAWTDRDFRHPSQLSSEGGANVREDTASSSHSAAPVRNDPVIDTRKIAELHRRDVNRAHRWVKFLLKALLQCTSSSPVAARALLAGFIRIGSNAISANVDTSSLFESSDLVRYVVRLLETSIRAVPPLNVSNAANNINIKQQGIFALNARISEIFDNNDEHMASLVFWLPSLIAFSTGGVAIEAENLIKPFDASAENRAPGNSLEDSIPENSSKQNQTLHDDAVSSSDVRSRPSTVRAAQTLSVASQGENRSSLFESLSRSSTFITSSATDDFSAVVNDLQIHVQRAIRLGGIVLCRCPLSFNAILRVPPGSPAGTLPSITDANSASISFRLEGTGRFGVTVAPASSVVGTTLELYDRNDVVGLRPRDAAPNPESHYAMDVIYNEGDILSVSFSVDTQNSSPCLRTELFVAGVSIGSVLEVNFEDSLQEDESTRMNLVFVFEEPMIINYQGPPFDLRHPNRRRLAAATSNTPRVVTPHTLSPSRYDTATPGRNAETGEAHHVLGGVNTQEESRSINPHSSVLPSPHGESPAARRAGELAALSISWSSESSNVGLVAAGGHNIHGLRSTSRSILNESSTSTSVTTGSSIRSGTVIRTVGVGGGLSLLNSTRSRHSISSGFLSVPGERTNDFSSRMNSIPELDEVPAMHKEKHVFSKSKLLRLKQNENSEWTFVKTVLLSSIRLSHTIVRRAHVLESTTATPTAADEASSKYKFMISARDVLVNRLTRTLRESLNSLEKDASLQSNLCLEPCFTTRDSLLDIPTSKAIRSALASLAVLCTDIEGRGIVEVLYNNTAPHPSGPAPSSVVALDHDGSPTLNFQETIAAAVTTDGLPPSASSTGFHAAPPQPCHILPWLSSSAPLNRSILPLLNVAQLVNLLQIVAEIVQTPIMRYVLTCLGDQGPVVYGCWADGRSKSTLSLLASKISLCISLTSRAIVQKAPFGLVPPSDQRYHLKDLHGCIKVSASQMTIFTSAFSAVEDILIGLCGSERDGLHRRHSLDGDVVPRPKASISIKLPSGHTGGISGSRDCGMFHSRNGPPLADLHFIGTLCGIPAEVMAKVRCAAIESRPLIDVEDSDSLLRWIKDIIHEWKLDSTCVPKILPTLRAVMTSKGDNPSQFVTAPELSSTSPGCFILDTNNSFKLIAAQRNGTPAIWSVKRSFVESTCAFAILLPQALDEALDTLSEPTVRIVKRTDRPSKGTRLMRMFRTCMYFASREHDQLAAEPWNPYLIVLNDQDVSEKTRRRAAQHLDASLATHDRMHGFCRALFKAVVDEKRSEASKKAILDNFQAELLFHIFGAMTQILSTHFHARRTSKFSALSPSLYVSNWILGYVGRHPLCPTELRKRIYHPAVWSTMTALLNNASNTIPFHLSVSLAHLTQAVVPQLTERYLYCRETLKKKLCSDEQNSSFSHQKESSCARLQPLLSSSESHSQQRFGVNRLGYAAVNNESVNDLKSELVNIESLWLSGFKCIQYIGGVTIRNMDSLLNGRAGWDCYASVEGTSQSHKHRVHAALLVHSLSAACLTVESAVLPFTLAENDYGVGEFPFLTSSEFTWPNEPSLNIFREHVTYLATACRASSITQKGLFNRKGVEVELENVKNHAKTLMSSIDPESLLSFSKKDISASPIVSSLFPPVFVEAVRPKILQAEHEEFSHRNISTEQEENALKQIPNATPVDIKSAKDSGYALMGPALREAHSLWPAGADLLLRQLGDIQTTKEIVYGILQILEWNLAYYEWNITSIWERASADALKSLDLSDEDLVDQILRRSASSGSDKAKDESEIAASSVELNPLTSADSPIVNDAAQGAEVSSLLHYIRAQRRLNSNSSGTSSGCEQSVAYTPQLSELPGFQNNNESGESASTASHHSFHLIDVINEQEQQATASFAPDPRSNLSDDSSESDQFGPRSDDASNQQPIAQSIRLLDSLGLNAGDDLIRLSREMLISSHHAAPSASRANIRPAISTVKLTGDSVNFESKQNLSSNASSYHSNIERFKKLSASRRQNLKSFLNSFESKVISQAFSLTPIPPKEHSFLPPEKSNLWSTCCELSFEEAQQALRLLAETVMTVCYTGIARASVLVHGTVNSPPIPLSSMMNSLIRGRLCLIQRFNQLSMEVVPVVSAIFTQPIASLTDCALNPCEQTDFFSTSPKLPSIASVLWCKQPVDSVKTQNERYEDARLTYKKDLSVLQKILIGKNTSSYRLISSHSPGLCLPSMSSYIWLKPLYLNSTISKLWSNGLQKLGSYDTNFSVHVDRGKAATAKAESDTVWAQCTDQILNRPGSALRGQLNTRPFLVVFKGEGASDFGGPFQEFLSNVSREVMGRAYGDADNNIEKRLPAFDAFIPCQNAAQSVGSNVDTIIPNSCGLAAPIDGHSSALFTMLAFSAIEESELLSRLTTSDQKLSSSNRRSFLDLVEPDEQDSDVIQHEDGDEVKKLLPNLNENTFSDFVEDQTWLKKTSNIRCLIGSDDAPTLRWGGHKRHHANPSLASALAAACLGVTTCSAASIHATNNSGSEDANAANSDFPFGSDGLLDVSQAAKQVAADASLAASRLRMMEVLGRLFGMAMTTASPLNVNINPIIWKRLSACPLTGADLDLSDLVASEMYRTLATMCSQLCSANDVKYNIQTNNDETLDSKFLDHNEVPSISFNGKNFNKDLNESDTSLSAETPDHLLKDLLFETESASGDVSKILSPDCLSLLKRKGVCPLTLTLFVRLATTQRLNEASQAVRAIVQGLGDVIPLGRVRLLFDEKRLERMICGARQIDLQILSEHTVASSPTAKKQLFEVLGTFSNSQLQNFLRFVSGRSRLPTSRKDWILTVDLESGPVRDFRLPTSATCSFRLSLPQYSSTAILKEKLLYAIQNCTAIDLDGDVRHEQMNFQD